ncbi:MAG: hypothetical protein ACRD12_14820 [Acidimicrobiales bacterium]
MSAVRCLALCLVSTLAAPACAASGDAELTAGATTSTVPTMVPTTTTTTALQLPTTAPRATDAPPEATTTTEATTTSSTTTTTRPPVLGSPVSYNITGGIAGVNDRLTIAPDGAATFQSASKTITFTVARAQLMRLASALTAADFPTLQSVYGFAMPDGFEYRVSYAGKTVLIFGSAEPAKLRPALTILAQEMERGRTS